MTNKEAEDMLSFWMDTLGLQNWDIHLAWQCTKEEMPDDDCVGFTSYDEISKQATIYILDENLVNLAPFTYDFEVTLVHELMHLKTALFVEKDRDNLHYKLLHCLVEDMAQALVNMKRYKE